MKNPFIAKEGKYYYLYYYNHSGRRKKITTHKQNKSEAERFKFEFMKNDNVITELKFISIRELEKEFTSSLARKPKTIKSYNTALNQFTKFCGEKNVNQYTVQDANHFLKQKTTEASDWSARKYRTALSTVFDYAVRMRYLKNNIFKETFRVSVKPLPPLSYSDDEINRLLSVIDKPVYRDIALFSFYSGMRLSEVLNVKNEHINEQFIILPTSKEDVPRVISISEGLREIINRHISASKTYLFEYKNRQFLMETVSHNFTKYKKKAGINPKLNFHSLRKTFGSRLLNAGVSLSVISEMLGHSSVRVTEQYYATLLKEYRPEVNLIKLPPQKP